MASLAVGYIYYNTIATNNNFTFININYDLLRVNDIVSNKYIGFKVVD